ncbi:MAG: HAD family hydrolase [Deltaproteobacteria bacterium]|nr:HAD family hydrolase [Deltaproteobacteria bacterium]
MPQSAKNHFKAAVFDLDGTLLDTLDDLTDSVNTVLAMRGFPGRTREEMRYFVGDGIVMLVRRVLPEGAKDEKTVEECVALLREIYGKTWNAKTKPYEGIVEMLSELDRAGLMLAVLSNKPDANTKETVKFFFPGIPFKMILGERLGVPKKPDPAGAVEIAESLGLSPSEILYLGDTSIDMKTAIAAGMHPVGALWGFRTQDELASSGAAHLAKTPADVVELARP